MAHSGVAKATPFSGPFKAGDAHMSDNFGFKIGIKFEKDFKNALRDINQSFKVLGSQINHVASQFDLTHHSESAVICGVSCASYNERFLQYAYCIKIGLNFQKSIDRNSISDRNQEK